MKDFKANEQKTRPQPIASQYSKKGIQKVKKEKKKDRYNCDREQKAKDSISDIKVKTLNTNNGDKNCNEKQPKKNSS